MDTTRVEIIGKQLEKIVDNLTQQSSGMSSGEIALYATLIGASSAILGQLIIFYLTKYKERKNLIYQLVADERRIAHMLIGLYSDLVMHKVHKKYWYRTSEIHNHDKDDIKDSHQRHFVSNERGFETMTQIRLATSEYFKTITHFTILTNENKNEIISQALNDIKTFSPRQASDFNEMKTYEELLKAQPLEESELNKIYQFYSECFDRINNEMKKKM